MNKTIIVILAFLLITTAQAYTYSGEGNRTGSGKITKIYGGRDTSFIYFDGDMDDHCPYGGMYLGDPESTLTTSQQNRLLALAIAAKSQGKEVILNYKYTTGTTDSFACYAYGIEIEN